jgi:hypothetical protein
VVQIVLDYNHVFLLQISVQNLTFYLALFLGSHRIPHKLRIRIRTWNKLFRIKNTGILLAANVPFSYLRLSHTVCHLQSNLPLPIVVPIRIQSPISDILSPLTGVKVSYEVGFMSTQAWGCPFSIKCLFNDIKSAPTSSLPLPRTLPFPIDVKTCVVEISRQILMCPTKRKDLPTLFPL